MTNRTSFFQLNATLDIAFKEGAPKDLATVLTWLTACLNCNTNHAELVKVDHATEFLDWPDFLDAPGFGPEHPDYPAAIVIYDKIKHWLTLDRKALISALQAQHLEAETEKIRQKIAEEAAALNAKKAKALDRLMAELSEAGFDGKDGINGGDCVDLTDGIYQRLKRQFPR